MNEALLDLFGARSGLVCAVGAGGKKSTLYRLAAAHPGHIALTTTVFTPPLPAGTADATILGAGEALTEEVLQASATQRRVAYAGPLLRPDRLAGVPGSQVSEIHKRGSFDATFVKADGARMRWIKAPGEGEPLLPTGTTTLLALMSARALGEPLTERIAHRVANIAEVTGATPGDPITPAQAARLLASERGLLKDAADCQIVPVINMVDDEARESLARATAAAVLALTKRFDRVILACMNRHEQPVVAVVER